MKEKKPRNIAAFPSPDQGSYFGSEGMLLRDYFAARAMGGFMSSEIMYQGEKGRKADIKNIVGVAYEVADEMLRHRELDIE